jgi:hypothetical protein
MCNERYKKIRRQQFVNIFYVCFGITIQSWSTLLLGMKFAFKTTFIDIIISLQEIQQLVC